MRIRLWVDSKCKEVGLIIEGPTWWCKSYLSCKSLKGTSQQNMTTLYIGSSKCMGTMINFSLNGLEGTLASLIHSTHAVSFLLIHPEISTWIPLMSYTMQIDVDIGSSSVARSIIHLVLGYVTSIVVDLAILIEVCTIIFTECSGK